MTKITRQDVEKIAHLARLNIEDNRIPEYASMLSKIFEFIEHINEADTQDVPPMAHPLPDQTQRLRKDQVTESNQREQFQAIADYTEAGVYLVPKVIDSD